MSGEPKVPWGAAFSVARVAHWLANDPGYTRAMAIRDLAKIARGFAAAASVPEDVIAQWLGDANDERAAGAKEAR